MAVSKSAQDLISALSYGARMLLSLAMPHLSWSGANHDSLANGRKVAFKLRYTTGRTQLRLAESVKFVITRSFRCTRCH